MSKLKGKAWLSSNKPGAVFFVPEGTMTSEYINWDQFKEHSMEMNEGLRKIWVQNLRDFAEELEDYGKDDS